MAKPFSRLIFFLRVFVNFLISGRDSARSFVNEEKFYLLIFYVQSSNSTN